MHEVGDLDIKAAARKVVISASISLFVMLVDLAFVLRDEFEHVLSHLRSSWRSRLYVSVRCIGLLGQTFNVYFASRMYLGIYTSPAGCYVWFSYQALIVQILLFYVEYLLAKRVLALFLGSQAILMMLVAFLLAQYTPSCWVTRVSPGNAFFSATTMTTHIVIFFMTFWRFFRLPKEFTHQGLGRTVFRDSTFTLATISMIMLFMTLTSLEVIKPTMSGNIVFSWLVCTLWISMGHIYVSQEKIKHDVVLSKMWGSVRLTSQIEMGDVSMCSFSDGPMASTLHGSFSTPMSKASQLSPSNGSREWSRDASSAHAGPGSTLVDTPPSLSGRTGEVTSREEDAQGHDSGDGPSSTLQPPLSEAERTSADNVGSCSQSSGMDFMKAPVANASPSNDRAGDADAEDPR